MGSNLANETVRLNQEGIKKLSNDKPVVYKILTEGDRNNYTGIAKRGRVRERLQGHLPGGADPIPGAKVRVEQMPDIKAAQQKEARIIARSKPPYNEQGK